MGTFIVTNYNIPYLMMQRSEMILLIYFPLMSSHRCCDVNDCWMKRGCYWNGDGEDVTQVRLMEA